MTSVPLADFYPESAKGTEACTLGRFILAGGGVKGGGGGAPSPFRERSEPGFAEGEPLYVNIRRRRRLLKM